MTGLDEKKLEQVVQGYNLNQPGKRIDALIDQIREIRNFWCHQCYLDYIYIQDEVKRERRFQEIANRLSRDENRTWDLHEKLEKMRLQKLKKYHRV